MSKTRRTVKNSKKTASVSRSKAYSAAKAVKSRRAKEWSRTNPDSYKSAPALVKK